MGGGFGITGAIKGAAQAAVLNAATGVVRGIGDGISDFASSLHTKASKILCCLTMFFRNSILRCKIVFMVAILACQIEYSTHKGIL